MDVGPSNTQERRTFSQELFQQTAERKAESRVGLRKRDVFEFGVFCLEKTGVFTRIGAVLNVWVLAFPENTPNSEKKTPLFR